MVGVHSIILFCCFVFVICVDNNKPPEKCTYLGKNVDCAGRKFKTVPLNLPSWTTDLDLHNNLLKNLSSSVWQNLTDLYELNLSKNKIQNIPKDDFVSQKHLRILELNQNKFTTINTLAFQSFPHLISLKLKKNHISKLEDGAFYGLQHIEKLVLDYNDIETVTKGWLYGLNSLKKLSISHNQVSKIEGDAWEFCQSLSELNLSFNKLESIQTDIFKHLNKLEKLNLNNNNLIFVEENSYSFAPLVNLQILYFKNNRISLAIEDANGVFQNLTKLVKFYISNNGIKSINQNAFSGLTSLIHLNMLNNNISTIQENAFAGLPNLKDLSLNTTALICDSNLRWFSEWIRINNFKLNVTCAFPPELSGKDLSKINLNDMLFNEIRKPKLLQDLSPEIMALKGENVSLHCTARSTINDNMTFRWTKDSFEINPIKYFNRNILTSDKAIDVDSVLNLTVVQNSDAGKYQCVVSNSFGKTYSQKATVSVVIFPTFIKTPSNITVKAGDTAKLECSAHGEPQPEIAWHKDSGNNFPAASERRMFMMPTDDVIFITHVKLADMGIYSCTAHNAAGVAVANATLTVEQEPSFVSAMENTEVMAGEDVIFKCKAAGAPKPTIRWLKDGLPITATERHFFTAEDQLMIIVDTTQSDSGEYQCRLNNSLGERTASSRLLVKPTVLNSRDMWGIIIIAVVCCAVITSLIWVMIIYQTRKYVPSSQLSEPVSFPLPKIFTDDASDRSSCKDSGTGDSAKRSSDDLTPEEFDLVVMKPVYPTTSTFTPLLHYPHSTNHDRIDVVDGPSTSSLQSEID